MQNLSVQLSLPNIYANINKSFVSNKSNLLSLLEEHINFDSFISLSFRQAFYSHMGRDHIYHLNSFIRALVFQKILGIDSDILLINILKLSPELCDFCRFRKVPDSSQFSRFRKNYALFIFEMFNKLVEITEPICREINKKKADYLIYDTTGFESYVAENNPKFFNSKLKQAKKFSKTNDSNPYMAVYSILPSSSNTNPEVRQQYINGHFCYALKAGILTNGLGIIRHISFFDDEFRKNHPEISSQKSDNPDIDKEISDSKSLKPVLSDFFNLHPTFSFKTFLGDSAFDSYDNYSLLRNTFYFNRVCTPINPRNSKISSDSSDIPVCPIDNTPFTFLGKSSGKNRSVRYKWVCHKCVPKGSSRTCICENPCTTSKYGKCTYTYPDKDFRICPGIQRDTEHWNNLYKHRVLIERTINLIKDTFVVEARKSWNTITTKVDVYFAGITQLIGVLLAKALHKFKDIKSIKRLIA